MKKSLLAIFTFIALSLPTSLYAQTNESGSAKIEGKITDAATGETLIGANVIIDGTSFGSASNLDGEFMIPGIPVGTYTIRFRYIGYKEVVKENIELSSGQTLTMDAALSAESIMGEEIIVTSQVKGQRAAINQQRSSNAIVNIVSSDKIRDMPDVNAAESIGRLPGVSLQRSGGEGNKIVVRGLSPQFSIVKIDGVRLEGVDGNRGVGLSMVSSEMLDGIELTKSLTADKDADAIGGTVNLRTRTAASGFHFDVLALGGYNSVEESFKNYKFSANVGNRFFDNKFGILGTVGTERVTRSSDNLSAGYGINITDLADELYTNNATLNQREKIRYRNNVGLVLDYKTDFMKIKLNNIYNQMEDENLERANIYRFSSSDFQWDMIEDLPLEKIQSHSLNTEFKLGNTQLNLDLSYSRTTLDKDRDLYHFADDNILQGSSIVESKRLFAMPDDLINEFYTEKSSIDKSILLWNDRSTLKREDITKRVQLDYKIPFAIGKSVSGNIQIGGKYSKKERSSNNQSRRNSYQGGIGIGKAGDIYDKYFPDFKRPQDLGFSNAEGIAGKNFEDPNYDGSGFLNGQYELPWSADLGFLQYVMDSVYRVQGENIDKYNPTQGVPSYASDYENTEELMAGYVMLEINIGKKLMLLPGIRYEGMHTEYSSNYVIEDPFDPSGVQMGYPKPVTASRDNAHWFPSINAKYDLNDWLDFRGAYYKSASRPDYSLLSPSMVSDQTLTNLRSYNPYLEPGIAQNFDLGVSFFNNKLGLLTFNVFYKEIDNLLYRLPTYKPEFFDQLEGAPEELLESLAKPRELYDEDLYKESGTKNNNMPINNPNKAYYRGFEANWQTNFWYLPGPILSGLVLDLNYSLIWSETKLPYIGFRDGVDTTGFFPIPISIPVYETRDSRMLDQPASIFNARIGWDYKGFSSRLSFQYKGETITRIDPLYSLLDEVTGELFRMDLTLKQEIVEGLSVTLDFANLNKFIDERFVIAKDLRFPRSSQYYGSTIQLSARYQF